jgi:uncharacterized protein
MAASSLLALIDDIATLLDDVALMTKVAARQGITAADDVATMTQVAARKTAGVLGDDLALNAEQVTGVRADRELPVVWAVAKGSLRNKAILVPAALAISAVAPWAITPLLMVGGLFLCYEGAEKVLHVLAARSDEDAAHREELVRAAADPQQDLVAFEKDKIRGAIRTDFILSAEIIVITLGTVAQAGFGQQLAVLVGISLVITAGVYGLVAGIVKLDDAGLYLNRQAARWKNTLGQAILQAAPWLMKTLSVVGTAAMFLVGGGILVHGIAVAGHALEAFAAPLGWAAPVVSNLGNALAGMAAGLLVVGAVALLKRLRAKPVASRP